MKEKIIRFMRGRNGVDDYSRFLCILAIIIMIIDAFIFFLPLRLLGLGIFLYGYYRIFSRNTNKRIGENRRYLDMKCRFKNFFFKNQNKRLNNEQKYGNVYRIFECPNCSQKLRVPKGKGKIEISCRRCGNSFVRRS